MGPSQKFFILILTSLILNLVWEFSHYPLFIDLSGIPSTIHLIIASFGDMFYIALFYIIISLKNKTVKWINKPKTSDYVLIIALGLLTSISIEIVNVFYLGRWTYKPAMPTIFGIGLSPLIQLVITSILSLEIIKLSGRRRLKILVLNIRQKHQPK